jgi:hypothetical protein
MQEATKRQEEEIRRLKLEKQGYKEREETFKRAMLNSQKVLEQMKDNARKSAEIIIADAEVKAEKILNRAHSRLSQLHEDIAELKRQRVQIEVQIRADHRCAHQTAGDRHGGNGCVGRGRHQDQGVEQVVRWFPTDAGLFFTPVSDFNFPKVEPIGTE